MSASHSEITGDRRRPARTVGVRGSVLGVYFTLQCPECPHTFEVYQPTVAGLALGGHPCPGCGTISEVTPATLTAALAPIFPVFSYGDIAALTEEAARLAENWYRTPPLDLVLTYQGLNLGEPAERWLAAFFVQGLLAASGQGEKA